MGFIRTSWSSATGWSWRVRTPAFGIEIRDEAGYSSVLADMRKNSERTLSMKVPYDSLVLRSVISEIERVLTGGVIQHITQPAPSDLVLSVRSQGASHLLLLSCDAATPRAHLTSVKRPNPPSPPAFCMACRKYLEGSRILSVAQRGFDRILDISAQDREGESLLLVAELMGKHSNLILVREEGRIADSAKRISHRQSRFREVLPGKRYVPPPAPTGGADPFLDAAAEIEKLGGQLPGEVEAVASRIQARFQGISPFLANELALRGMQKPLEDVWEEVFGAAARREWSPVLIRDSKAEPIGAYPFPSVQFPVQDQNSRPSIDTALDHFYSVALPRAAADAARHHLQVEIDRALAAKKKQVVSLERSVAETARAEEFKQNGELILANLYRIDPEAASVTVTDYYRPEGPERLIKLDPQLSAQDNAEAWFRRYRKARDGAERLEEQLRRMEGDIAGLQSVRGRVVDAPDLAAIQALRQSISAEGLLRLPPAGAAAQEKKRAEFDGKKIRTVTTVEGWEILVGENSEANDYLTTRVAAPTDLWLHVRANTSAHVLIRTRNQPQSVPASVLRQAAEIAARHSPAKHSSLVPVDYTLRKYVRKPRGSAPGAALYQNEKTIYVTPAD
jgi:predicted ribosome quality control (RQC) complex YloA/Tae2 family protein